VRDELGDDFFDAEPDDDEPEPTPGERLLYALGQLYRRWHDGGLFIRPADFDIDELAVTIGVHRDIELVTDEPWGTSYHFAGEVLVADPDEAFPWRLMKLDEWAIWTDLEDAGRRLWGT